MSRLPYYESTCMPYQHTRLVFPREWLGTTLPNPWKHPVFEDNAEDQRTHFAIELLDTQDGTVYGARAWPHYEDPMSFDDESEATVHIHMFLEHYCACHRKIDAAAAGADTDEECEGERFVVKSITAPEWMPGLVLYSETMTAEELEATLPAVLSGTPCGPQAGSAIAEPSPS